MYVWVIGSEGKKDWNWHRGTWAHGRRAK